MLTHARLSYAGVMGLQADTHTSTSQYTWLGSIYYVGYMAAVPIHNRLMQRFTPSKYIATCMTLWGCVLASMAACNDWPGLMVQRTFLGSLEASVNCGFTLITAAWYRKYEHAGRVGIWSACVGLSGMLGGIIAFGCVSGYEERPNAYFTTWKILALCTGLLSVVYGVSMFFFMAGSVVSAKWFSDAERTLAVERLRDNHAGIGTRQYKRYQVKEAWLDHRVSVRSMHCSNQADKSDLAVCPVCIDIADSGRRIDPAQLDTHQIAGLRHQNHTTSRIARRAGEHHCKLRIWLSC